MSDGYRAFVGWVGDLLYHLHTVSNPEQKLADIHGVVLVDEVDLHLHPDWQRYVAHTLSTALPHIQFVLTTHSPIVTGTLTGENIFVMDPDPSGASTVRQLEEKVYGLTADQVLLSSYFNLKSSRAPGAENELRQIARRAWTGDSDAAAEFLKKLSGKDADQS
jgi:predicted ATP-binding protein involved in virulence